MEFSDNFPRLEVRGKALGGKKCITRERRVCLPDNCVLDTTRTHSSDVGGNFGRGGPGYGVFVSEINHPGGGRGRHSIDSSGRCLVSKVRVCAKRRQRGWYQGEHVLYGVCRPPCECRGGHWFDFNRDSCVTGAGCDVSGMPNGDKGGGFFAWDDHLFVDTECVCADLHLDAGTGTASWVVERSPIAGTEHQPPQAVANRPPNWATLAGATWVSASRAPRGTGPTGEYTYRLTFCLCEGFKNPQLALRILVDNLAAVTLNGTALGKASRFQNPPAQLGTNNAALFRPGPNVLDVVVTNRHEGSSTGLAVAGELSAENGRCPEP